MTNKVMIDSSILVEYIKNTKTKLLVELVGDLDRECYVNETVVSEFLYYFIATNSGKSPRAVQSAKEIRSVFTDSSKHKILSRFLFLPTNETLFTLMPELMSKYNLLPNDAIILASCKIHNITQLASHDADFILACEGEGIVLLRE